MTRELIVLFGPDAQARKQLAPRRNQIVKHLAACEDCQIELAALLESGSRTPTLSDDQRAQLKKLYDRMARAMRGPHLNEAPALYDRYIAEWMARGRRPEAPAATETSAAAGPATDLLPAIRHLARHPQCDEEVRALFSARLTARIAEEIAHHMELAEANLASMTETVATMDTVETATAAAERELGPALHWRELAREQNPVAIQEHMRLTDYEEYDIEVEHFTQGELTLVVWGPDRLHGNRKRTLKLLRPEHHDDPALREAFVAAAIEWCHVKPHGRTQAAPQLVRIPIFDNAPAVLVSYAPHTLRSMIESALRNHRPLTLAQAFGWSQQIAAALVSLHRQKRRDGVTPYIHGDLKPENILIGSEATAWLSDVGMEQIWLRARTSDSPRLHFLGEPGDPAGTRQSWVAAGAGEDVEAVEASLLGGDARAGSRGRVVGTARYMAPERWLGAEENGPKSDVYALGIVLHELFAGTGGGPFMPHPRSDAAWFRAHRTGHRVTLLELADVALSKGPLAEVMTRSEPRHQAERREMAEQMLAELDLLIHRCLAIMPEQRPTAAEVLGQLNELAGRLGLEREPEPPSAVAVAHPSNIRHQRRLAHSYGRAGEHERQLDLLLAAVAQAPAPDLWVGLGSALHDQGYNRLALRAYAAAEALNTARHEDQEDAERAAPHILAFHRGNAYRALGQHDTAVVEYGKTLAHQRAHVPAMWGVSAAHSRLAAAANAPNERRALIHLAREQADNAADQAYGAPHPKVRELHRRIQRAHDSAWGEQAREHPRDGK